MEVPPPLATWLGFTFLTVPSETSSNINRSFATSTLIAVPSVSCETSTVKSIAPLVPPPFKPEVADVLTAVISPSPMNDCQAEPS